MHGFLLKIVYINLEQYGNVRWLCPIGDSQGFLPQISTRQGNVRHSIQPDKDLNKSKPVVAIGLSSVISLLLVLI